MPKKAANESNSIIAEGEWVWSQKYRPQTIDDCILPESMKTLFKNIIKQGEIQNLLLSGSAGVGKTTSAIALCKNMNLDYMMINASDENGIDVLRNKIKQFASTVGISQEGNHKVVILDEADQLSNSSQTAFRAFTEAYSKNCRFILTCNFKNRLIEPLHSRCSSIDFNPKDFKNPDILKQMMDRLIYILDAEGVEYKKSVIAEIIFKWAPDWRRTINELQKYSINNGGVVDTGILISSAINVDIQVLVKSLKEKNYKDMRQWVADHQDTDSSEIFRKIFDVAKDIMEPASVPQCVLVLAEYGYRAAFVVDQQINTTAALTEIMMKCKFL